MICLKFKKIGISILQKKRARRPSFVRRLATRVRLIVLLTADEPEVGFHGLFAAGGVLLRLERLHVGSDVAQVLPTGLDRCCYRGEAVTCPEFVLTRSGRTNDFLAEVNTVTIAALGGFHAVRTQQHFGT